MKAHSLTMALVLLAAPLAAQEPSPPPRTPQQEPEPLPVSLRVRLGFSEKVPHDGFTPIRVDLESRDPEQEVSVVCYQADETGEELQELLRLGTVHLGRGQPRRLRGIAPARHWIRTPNLLVRALSSTGAVLGETTVHPDAAAAQVLLLLDRHSAAPADFSQLVTQTLDSKGQLRSVRWTTSLTTRVEDLPISPLGYTGAQAVLLGDLELERWDQARAQALAGWLAQGGELVVSLGSRGTLLKQSLLGRQLGEALAPIPYDQQPIAGQDVELSGLLGNFGPLQELSGLRPPFAAPIRPADDDVVLFRDDLRPRGRPFVVRRRHGRGNITLIAADLWSPPFLHAPHTRKLIEHLLSNQEDSSFSPRTQYIFHELKNKRQPAQIGPAFALLIIYALIAGPGVYFFLRAKKRGILLWLVIPALTVCFSSLVPFYRLMLNDAESTMVGVRLVESVSGRSVGVETLDMLLFSGSPDPKTFALKGDDASAFAVVPPRRMQSDTAAPRLGAALGAAGSDGLRFELPVALWGTRYVSFTRTWKAPRVTGSVALRMASRRMKVGIEVDYQGLLPLHDGLVVYPTRAGAVIHELGDTLRRGDRVSVSVESVTPASTYEATEKGLGGAVVVRLLRGLYRSSRKAYLLGWTEEPFPVAAEPNVRPRNCVTVLAVELPIHYEDGVPYGTAFSAIEASTIAEVGTSTITREVKTRLSLPGGGRRKAKRVRLRLTAQRGAILGSKNLRFLGLRYGEGEPEARAITLDPGELDESGRRMVLDLEEPSRWISSDGELLFMQRFDRQRMETDRGYSADLDVTVEWADGGG